MTKKNPYDMPEKDFQKYLKNFKRTRIKTDSEIAKEKNVSGIRFKDNTQVEETGITPHEYAKTPEGIKNAKKYMNDKGFKWDKKGKNIVPIPKAKGGYVKKYAKGGGVRKVRT